MPGARVVAASQRLKKGDFFSPVERLLLELMWGPRLSGIPGLSFQNFLGLCLLAGHCYSLFLGGQKFGVLFYN